MESQIKNCQNCKKDFVIESDDFAFYEKMKVPAPTWCPECRQQRRYIWRNESTLYRRNCDLCGKSVVTIYSQNKPYKVYCSSCWWSDKWNGSDFARNFDFSRPFFEQFRKLQLQVPRVALLSKNSINSEYTNHSNNNKNCYLSFSAFDSENVLYSSEILQASQNLCDCYWIRNGGQLLYECINLEKCYQCQYSMLLKDCIDCLYCYDLRGCSHCLLCSNLRNKQYYILNQKYTKEEYEQKVKELNLGSYASRVKLYAEYIKMMKENAVHKFAVVEKSYNVSGNVIANCKNVHNAFEVTDLEDAKYSIVSVGTKTSMDCFNYGFNSELTYECHALLHDYNVMFSHLSYDNSFLQYCDTCHNSENLFGCVSMKQSKFSIFNKQYSEKEYYDLKDKIISHMKKTGEYGEFFPVELCPFGYNETMAQVHMPLTKEKALELGFKWEDKIPGVFGKETLKPEQIPDNIADTFNLILKEALLCIQCSKNYNIVKAELEFYRRENIPIPRKCPDCRSLDRIAMRPPRKLWHRKCAKSGCQNEFETSYAPDRPEIVYCEQCYQQEVA